MKKYNINFANDDQLFKRELLNIKLFSCLI